MHRVIPWDDVVARRGDGHRPHRAGRGAEDFELVARPRPAGARRRSTSRGGCYRATARSRASRPDEAERRDRSRTCGAASCSSRSGRITHRYPICWRCETPLVFRVVDDWFIACGRDPPADARRERDRRVDARTSTRSGWTTGCATWATGTSRASATSGCRSRSTRAHCGELNVIGSRAELRAARDRRARRAAGAAPAVDRRRHDLVRRVRQGRAPDPRGRRRLARRRASSRSRRSAGTTRSGSSTATRPARPQGLSGADLPDHAYWEKWFPADWISEMREQIRLWFYSMLFMSVTLDRASRRTGPCSRTRSCSTSTGARCTARGGTRSTPTRRSTDGRRRHALACSASRSRARTSSSATGRRTRSSAGCSRSGTRSSSSSTTRTWRPSRATQASSSRSTAGSQSRAEQLVAEMTRRVRALLDAGRDRSRSSRSSTTCRTGTSAGRGGASGTATRRRSRRFTRRS